VVAALVLGLYAPLFCQVSAEADAPTPTVDPLTIDRIWQKASAAYDGQRAQILKRVDHQASDGPFRPEWQSLATYQVPDWYKDAKFGIFIHWGLYAVPAFGSEQYPRAMYTEGSKIYKHHLETYGPLNKFGYKDFIPMFQAEHYDPAAWARLFQQAGAKYVVPVFEHHDGFAMYNSDLSDWTAAKMGPHRDLAGDLAIAVRAEGLHVGASSHRIEHDWFMGAGRRIESDLNDPRLAGFYGPSHLQFALDEEADNFLEDWTYVSPEFASDWLARDAEIVEKYHPELFYFDFWIGHPEVRSYLARFAAFFYNETSSRGSLGVINYKLDGSRVPLPENGPQRKWELVLYAIKGWRKVTRIYSDVIETRGDANLSHGAQKPVALYENLLKRSVRPGDSILDPFAGTGTIFPAAHSVLCKATGIEINDIYAGIAAARLKALSDREGAQNVK